MSLKEKIHLAYYALSQNNLLVAKELIEQSEQEILSLEKDNHSIQLAADLGGVMIDYGTWTKELEIIKRGTLFALEIVEAFPEEKLVLSHYYNLANGYSALKSFAHQEAFDNGSIPREYLDEKAAYRKVIQVASTKKLNKHERQLLPEILTNYGNVLDTVGRPVEALEFYNRALGIKPNKPETLGNKAITLKRLAINAHGHTHLFILEAKRLFELALGNSPHPQLGKHLSEHLKQIQAIIDAHEKDFSVEQYQTPESTSDFHEFMRNICFRHKLYLTPTTLIGQKENQFFGDPLFISEMRADLGDTKKFDRYITFFNQIKQDYIFARYLLVQSQYQANHAEVIDQDVDFYYPLDYSLYSSYVEMLKVSYRLAVDTLDKVGFFVKDYCDLKSLSPRETKFRNVFSTRKNPLELRSELKQQKNIYLFGLLDLALDLREGGIYSLIYERRNALTHRFLSIHAEGVIENDQDKTLPKLQIDEFRRETIQVLQILKAAIIYLILFVDVKEKNHTTVGLVMPVVSTKVDGVFRWKPSAGDSNV
ncbi:MAG: hypothetical protein FVQ83_16845 [Chloroflexi bacterium]|nr:hypothetical protein [Chloroflexota bacterium]